MINSSFVLDYFIKVHSFKMILQKVWGTRLFNYLFRL